MIEADKGNEEQSGLDMIFIVLIIASMCCNAILSAFFERGLLYFYPNISIFFR